MAPASPPRVVLASGSPRRVELLGRLGIHPAVCPSGVEERWHPSEPAEDFVRRVAAEKADAVHRVRLASGARGEEVVLGADTAVVLDGEPLGKPADAEQARWMLGLLSGRTHRVLTAVTVLSPLGAVHVLETALVSFAPLVEARLEWYLSTGESIGKAGAYALQGAGAALVERVEGDPTTVIGLPLHRTAELLVAAGAAPWCG